MNKNIIYWIIAIIILLLVLNHFGLLNFIPGSITPPQVTHPPAGGGIIHG